MSNGKIPFVPHIVNLPPSKLNREEFFRSQNITDRLKGKTVIGRIGGFNTFDIPFVHKVIEKLAATGKFYFWFIGTKRFSNQDNLLFSNEINALGQKSLWINGCDAMLHGRQRGESFGLSIAEFLYCNKPVMAWNNGYDQNHMEMLKDSGLLYNNAEELEEMLWNIHDFKGKEDWTKRVEQYQPIPVMNKFKEVFLS